MVAKMIIFTIKLNSREWQLTLPSRDLSAILFIIDKIKERLMWK